MILTMNQLHLLEVVVTVVQLERHDSCLRPVVEGQFAH